MIENRAARLTEILLAVTLPAFVATGYLALYWAWPRGDLDMARPYLPWARTFGMFAMLGAVAAFAILFSTHRLPVSTKTRLRLSVLATLTVGSFAEFRNEGKFYFKGLHHFFGPGTWAHDALNGSVPALGDFLYRVEYSHWNDFLLGPGVVSLLFLLGFARLDQDPRFVRILMNVGLFWFFIQAWAEKAGYFPNPYSSDEIDLPVEFAGTMLGFWMARVLTRPIDGRKETFRSTVLVDVVASGVVGLVYTLLVGPLTEGVARAVGHGLYDVVPAALEAHEYTPFERHVRPMELLLLAGLTWWGLNVALKPDPLRATSALPAPAAEDETPAPRP